MRYWLLCGKLKVIENLAYVYHIGGKTMGIKTPIFEKIMRDAIRVISDLSNRLEKAEKERDDALELLHSYRHICGETPPERLSEMVQADREGRCTIFPCRDWLDLVFGEQEVFYGIDTDYIKNPIREITVYNENRFTWYDGWKQLVFCGKDENGLDWEFSPEEVGKSVFCTYKEAESALKAMKESNHEKDN